VRGENRDDAGQDSPGHGRGTVEVLLTGGDPRNLRNVGIVIDLACGQPERLEELVQCVFSADEIVRMRASDALEKVCRSQPRLLQRFVPRLLAEMSRIEQASVQWHLAQILSEVPLDDQQQAQAIAVLEPNLDTCGDWIVTNCTLEALGVFAWTNPAARAAGRTAAPLPAQPVQVGRVTSAQAAGRVRQATRCLTAREMRTGDAPGRQMTLSISLGSFAGTSVLRPAVCCAKTGSITLAVDDLARWVAFCRDGLDWQAEYVRSCAGTHRWRRWNRRVW
jgi:hypothetical protein